MPENIGQNFGQPSGAWQRASGKLGALWCDWMHDSPMWPIHDWYECRTCGRRHPVPWAGFATPPAPFATAARVRPFRVPFASLLLLILLAIMMVLPIHASDASLVASTEGASRAFARYLAGLEVESPWRLETVEIDASLPKLEKHGRLRAIRRLLPLGKPEYEVLEIEGDQTVEAK
jgi:hypothetical protein